MSDVTLRLAFPDDADELARLTALDSASPLCGPVLLAEAGGELVAARSLSDGRVLADPFRRTVEHLDLLRTRAAQLTAADRRARRPHRRLMLRVLALRS